MSEGPRANDRGDVWFLSKMLMAERSSEQVANIAAAIKAEGLMLIPRGAFWLTPLVWLVKWRRGWDDYRVWLEICTKRPQIARDLINDTIEHMRNGLDTEDEDSVGGFSQREIDILMSILSKTWMSWTSDRMRRCRAAYSDMT